MAKIFVCDKCGQQFGGPLDEVKVGEVTYDLCAPCRANLNNTSQQAQADFFADTIPLESIQVNTKPVGLKAISNG